jgi:hypothetical protein
MVKRSAWSAAVLLAAAMVLTACSSGSKPAAASSSTPAVAAQSSTPAALPTGTVAGSNTGSSFCGDLTAARTYFASLEPTLIKGAESGSYATYKADMGSFLSKALNGLAAVESTMTGAPANVQAALTVVNKAYLSMQTAVASSTSLTSLGLAMEGILGRNENQLKAASNTLTAYAVSQCGSAATAAASP